MKTVILVEGPTLAYLEQKDRRHSMIPFDFDYYRPTNIQEAVQILKKLDAEGKEPLYYSGGSEIISMARVHNIYTKAVIDLKAIPECSILELQEDSLIIGSCATLSQISESKLFPLLEKTVSRIADHTMQCKITIGGNIAGTIIYREAVLPLMISDCTVVVADENGVLKKVSIHEVFNERLQLAKGQFIVQFVIDKEYTSLPYVHVKKTKIEKIDYPLLTVVAVKINNQIRIAFSGVCSFPFRSFPMEDCLNNHEIPVGLRVENSLELLPAPYLTDISGSGNYRKFVLKETLSNALKTLEEMH